eukprot:NODE_4088_length_610_cov_960.654189_g2934_i0.p2 GENE.NODE_4088_length_610_cov_960.654189_g2934_i0~~NODE_4088_length_610_cov_960.654189_g2934_i0.p2  ORF type:complete len:172 (-),score=45.07 NODE_4088_length_610_cov_960.654189_g2934_i0:26-541(-)
MSKSLASKLWLYGSWVPRGIPKAMANELSAVGQAIAHPEALARVSQLESQGKNPLRVARAEYFHMWMACQPYRIRNSIVEWEKLKTNLCSGKVDGQDFIDLIYLLLWAWVLYKIGECVGRGSIYGYRFDGEEHRLEVQRSEEYVKKEAAEMEKVMAQLEKEIAAWMATMED